MKSRAKNLREIRQGVGERYGPCERCAEAGQGNLQRKGHLDDPPRRGRHQEPPLPRQPRHVLVLEAVADDAVGDQGGGQHRGHQDLDRLDQMMFGLECHGQIEQLLLTGGIENDWPVII